MMYKIENLLNMENDEVRSLYNSWDKGDCSVIGLSRILMIQEIKKEIETRGVHYDGQYDELLKSLYKEYNT